MKLSAIVITKNAGPDIDRTLKSLAFADERIVIDSGSVDDTRERAARLGAKVLTKTWQGYGTQKNYGRSIAQGDWVLFIDDDEVVTPELQKSITQAINNPDKDFYWLRIVTIFLKKPLKHLYGHNSRLFRTKAGKWTDDLVHEQVQSNDGARIQLGDPHSRVLTGELLHYSHPTTSSYLRRMDRYTTLDAKQMAQTKKHRSGREITPSFFLPLHLAARQFIKLFIYRKGFKDGWAGFIWCLFSAYYEFTMGKKFLKLV